MLKLLITFLGQDEQRKERNRIFTATINFLGKVPISVRTFFPKPNNLFLGHMFILTPKAIRIYRMFCQGEVVDN